MYQNGQTHFKNLAAFAARFLKCVWPFWDVMYWRVKFLKNYSEGVHFYHVAELASLCPHSLIINLSKINIFESSYKKPGRVDRDGKLNN